jgi:DNA-binding response OmpR family regulator
MKKILIIEDDIQLRKIYAIKLEEAGYEVASYATGAEGLEAIKEKLPDLIILDIMLPGGMNGFDVLEQLKNNPHLRTIPVIILTNLDSEEHTASTVGSVEYIVKTNISLDDIVKKVQSYVPIT